MTAVPAALIVAACGGGGGSGGAGASAAAGTGTGAGSTGNCNDPKTGLDCAACSTNQACFDCEGNIHPNGQVDFENYIECAVCVACFKTCGGAPLVDAGVCSAPTTASSCDVGAAGDPSACQACTRCAVMPGGVCLSSVEACKANADCLAIVTEIGNCGAN